MKKGKHVEKHFVTFYSPGILFAEDTTLSIVSWDVDKAVEMSRKIVERYQSRPYGFKFSTRARGPRDLDSKETKRSGMYFLGGQVETLSQVEARNDPRERILLSNMRGNGYKRIVRGNSPWQWVQPLHEGDVVL